MNKNGFTLIYLLVIIIFICLLGFTLYKVFYPIDSSSLKPITNIEEPINLKNKNDLKNEQNLIENNKVTPTPYYKGYIITPFPDFSEQAPKSETKYDKLSWLIFEDKQMGLKFKHPKQWGVPKVIFREGSDAGTLYSVTFPNSTFQVGGTSREFSEGRGATVFDFNGFGNKLFWENAQELCQDQDFFECKIENEKILLINGASCYEDYRVIPTLSKILIVDRPGKIISGLVFGGEFADESYLKPAYDWFCNLDNEDTNYISIFNDALRQRRLNLETMANLDLFEEVFKTVEFF